MINGNGRNIVLFVPKYFGYEIEIKKRLEDYGFKVRLIYENLDKKSHYYKFIKSKFPSKICELANHYFQKEIKKCSSDTEIVIVIRGEYLNVETIRLMKKRFVSDCRFILYQWDGTSNNPNSIEISKEFDRVLTFDVKDSDLYGWVYRPLFYLENHIEHSVKDIDLLYICSLHSERVRILNELKQICDKNGYTYRAVLYEKKYIYLKRKYIDRKTEYINASDSDVTYHPLTIDQTYKLYGRSRVVVDFTHPGQTGYTMRTIECIGNKCKLITNNAFIKEADFFDKNNISIYQKSLIIPPEFLCKEYKSNDLIANCYSLDAFLNDLLV